MSTSKPNDFLTNFGNKVAAKLNLYETILVSIFVIALILKLSTSFPMNELFSIVLSILSLLYFFNAYSVPDDENFGKFERFVNKLSSWGCSVAIIGILFCLRNYPGYSNMLTIGGGTSFFSIIAVLYLKSKKPELEIFSKRHLIRLLIIGLIALSLNFIPKEDLVKYKLLDVKVEKTK